MQMSASKFGRPVLIVGLALLLASCAAGPNDANQGNATGLAGFWLGLWQGAISPITFVVSLFNDHVNIYEVHNNGNWNNFGFMLGVCAAFSGAAGSGAASRSGRPGR
jgi:hypothetical protein